MGRSAESARRFWQDMLTADGSTVLPRWTREPGTGVRETEFALGGDLLDRLRGLAGELAVSLSSVLLAGHARVLAALTGERTVNLGYVAGGSGSALPCRIDTGCPTWRELLAESFCIESAVLVNRAFPVERLRAQLNLAGPVFDTAFDPTGAHEDLVTGDDPDGPALWVGLDAGEDGLSLRLRCRARVWDGDALDRVAGYHLRALESLLEDLDADPARTVLPSRPEIELQIHRFAGPGRELPDLRVHQLYQAKAAATPDAVAAVCGDRRWSHRELNGNANRLGRRLLEHGLAREEVVAVVCHRNLDWMAAVLAVFKAGGVYLPIEPAFPPERIAAMLTRAGCRLVLAEPGSTANLDLARPRIPSVVTLRLDDPGTSPASGDREADLDVEVTADQLAYIYFTSGSTGEPKGAMCEHAGMLNHLLAKIDDTGLAEGQVMAQTAPQCFDISLWQLLAAPLVGGTTLLVDDESILDVARYLDTLVDAGVAVTQVVPSYLETVLDLLERRPRPLPDLRCVSTTGETLTTELAARWFAAQPEITLLNAYGLTETSDDTNHEAITHPPSGERVPLGRPIPNVWVYVVDEHLQPVPLGAPGEIVHSGVCVGRGYVNDPDRAAAYLPDPHRPGQRLYRGGDIGRWRPDGKLEFLGRRDSQVKIRGFRVEVEEVDNALRRAAGVRDCAVVPAGTGYHRHLVAFYDSSAPIHPDRLLEQLRRGLPEYMLPTVFHRHTRLPVTSTGTVDRAALTELAAGLEVERFERAFRVGRPGHEPPRGAAEERVRAAWASALGVSPTLLSRHDDFFDVGGTSLTAVKVAIVLNRTVSHREVATHPTIVELSRLLEQRGARPEARSSPAS